MEREVKNKAASVRAKLMNIARAEKIDFRSNKGQVFQYNKCYAILET